MEPIKSENLENDEFHIECELRHITGDLPDKFRILDERLKQEYENPELAPLVPHSLASNLPQAELSICMLKLQNLQSLLLNVIKTSDNPLPEIECINSRLTHLLGRTKRISSIPGVQGDAEKLFRLIKNLLEINEKTYTKSQPLDQTINDLSNIQIDPSEILSSLMKVKTKIEQAAPQLEIHDEQSIINTEPVSSQSDVNNVDINISSSPSTSTNISAIYTKSIPITQSNITYTKPDAYETRAPCFNYSYAYSNQYIPPQLPPYPNPNFYQPTIPNYPPFQPFNPFSVNIPRPVVPDHLSYIPNTINQPGANPYNEVNMTIPAATSTEHEQVPPQNFQAHPTQMYKWKLSFNGTDMTVEKFMFQVEYLSDTHGIPDQQLVNGLHLFLKGVPRDHYWGILQQNSNCTWNELKTSFLYRFKIRRSDIEIRQSIDNRKQKVNESFIEFYYAIQELAQPLTSPINDKEILEILKKNMLRELKLHLAGPFINTVTDLLSICTNVHQNKREFVLVVVRAETGDREWAGRGTTIPQWILQYPTGIPMWKQPIIRTHIRPINPKSLLLISTFN